MIGPPTLVLFGAGSLCGEALIEQLPPGAPWLALGRRQPPGDAGQRWRLCDLSDLTPEGLAAAASALPPGPQIWIAFAPIWLLAPFLAAMATRHPEALAGLNIVVACSSSSVITKRFAANRFDRELVARLAGSQQQLLQACERLGVGCRILQPTLIYGQVGLYADHNLSRLLSLMRRLPLLPLPARTGLRQPIHASQLAAVALQLARQLGDPGDGPDAALPQCLALGGDTTLSYRALLQALQQALPPGDPARRCRLLAIPNRLAVLLAAPLLLVSPKAFEAVLRMAADLAGFTPAHQLLNQLPEPFPAGPLAL